MVTQGMGSQVGGSNNIGGTQDHVRVDPKSLNPLAREGSLYNLTLDEVQSQLVDLGKPLSSMNLDELLKTVWTAEVNNQAVDCIGYGQSGLSLNQQSSLTLSTDLSKKTVDEVWRDIQQEQQQRSSLDRKGTLGEMTLEDFLVKAGVVAGSTNYLNPPILPQQQQSMLPIFAPGHPVHQQGIPLGGNPIMDVAYPETQMAMSTSPLMGALSDTQSPRRKRGPPPRDIAERSVERRQKRMIKNRESAARSRARKQAYTHELENKVSRLEEENERLKRLQELEKALPSVPSPPEPRYQLRRTSSAPM